MKEFRTVPTRIGIFLARAPAAPRSKSVKGLCSGPTEVPINTSVAFLREVDGVRAQYS